MKDCGEVAWFVGYSKSHPQNTLLFVKLNNHQIVITRNYRWTEKEKDWSIPVNYNNTIVTRSSTYLKDTEVPTETSVETDEINTVTVD